MGTIEYRNNIEIKAEYDIIVAGGGPAGICAAVAAARLGANVALMERYGVLGGNLTIGHVGPILGTVSEGTMRNELLSLLGVPENDAMGVAGVAHDMEMAKQVLAEFVYDAGVKVYLQSPVVDVMKDGERVTGLVISGKAGMYAINGKIVIDATGDGDAACYAGAQYQMGRDEDGLMQPVTLEFIIGDVDETKAIACIGEIDNVAYRGRKFLDYTLECCNEGILPSHLSSVRLHRTITPGQRCVNTTQVNGIDATDQSQLIGAEVDLRKQIRLIVKFLRSHVDGYENCKVISSGATLGVRETRRIMGEYVLDRKDLISGRKFKDAVVHKVNFIIDIHNPAGGGQAFGVPDEVIPYDIPYQCLIPKKIDDLVLSGRCISGTHKAHASYRVMGICMAIGQASGIIAALSVRESVSPRLLSPQSVQRELLKMGVDLFN